MKLLCEFDGHPKVLSVGNAGAGLYARSLAFCGRYETDGVVPREWAEQAVAREGQTDLPGELVSAGLWDVHESGFEIRDFTEVNKSREEMDDLRSKRSSAGRAGAKAKSQASAKQKGSKRLSTSSSKSASDVSPSVARAREAGFDDFLADHQATTGHTPPGPETKAYAALAGQFNSCCEDGHSLDELKLATRGAHADPNRRENGWDTSDSVLRVTKVHKLIEAGRKVGGGSFDDRMAPFLGKQKAA